MNDKSSLSIVCMVALSALLASLPAVAGREELLEMAGRIDQLDRQDFLACIDKADACISTQDFACADVQLAQAAKFTTGTRDRQMLAAARHKLANEKIKWTATH